MLRLSDREIHLWFAFPEETGDPWPSAARPILNPGESARMERLRLPEGRRLFEVSHLLVRTTLSRYADTPPEGWRFIQNPQGKPAIEPGLNPLRLHFNLAHTRGVAVFAVTGGAEIGVDVERADRRLDAAGLASRFFSPEEAAALQALPPDRQKEWFCLYWTLKESYIKARGLGLSLPLASFSFRLTGESPFRIEFSDAGQDPGHWRFAIIKPLPCHTAAVAIAVARPAPIRLRCFHARLSGEISPLDFTAAGLSPGVEI